MRYLTSSTLQIKQTQIVKKYSYKKVVSCRGMLGGAKGSMVERVARLSQPRVIPGGDNIEVFE